MDTRVGRLSRTVTNFIAETELRAAVRTRSIEVPAPHGDDVPPPIELEVAASANPTSSHSSSVDGLDNDDQVFAQLEDLDQKLDDAFDTLEAHTRTLDDLQGRVPHSPPPFSIGQLSEAMKQQFATITNDRDKLAARIESSTSKQLKINMAHDDDVNRLHEGVHALRATITRLELAPPAPLSLDTHSTSVSQHRSHRSLSRSPPPRVHSRSRSPSENHRDAKRSHHTSVVIEMGPNQDGSHQIHDGITVAAGCTL
jgi:hypothetical protein